MSSKMVSIDDFDIDFDYEEQEFLQEMYEHGLGNVRELSLNEIYPEEMINYYETINSVERKSNKMKKILHKAENNKNKPIYMYQEKLRRNSKYMSMDISDYYNYLDAMDELIDRYNINPYEVDENDIDSLVKLYQENIINSDVINSMSRLKQVEILMASAEYNEVNFTGDKNVSMDMDINNLETNDTDSYISKLIHGEI